MEPEVEIIEYLLCDVIASSTHEPSDDSGQNTWETISPSDTSGSFETDLNDDKNSDDDFFG